MEQNENYGISLAASKVLGILVIIKKDDCCPLELFRWQSFLCLDASIYQRKKGAQVFCALIFSPQKE